MDNQLIEHIVRDLRYLGRNVILAENPDDFLKRDDVIEALKEQNIFIDHSSAIEQRVAYELRDKEDYSKILVLVSGDNTGYLEDIQNTAVQIVFNLSDYLKGYHVPTLLQIDLNILEKLYRETPAVPLSKKETKEIVTKLIEEEKKNDPIVDVDKIENEIIQLLSYETKDWEKIIESISDAIRLAIGTQYFSRTLKLVEKVNRYFQEYLRDHYKQLVSTSAIKKPKIVSKILDYLSLSERYKKIALLVVDGMSYWQYQMLRDHFPENIHCYDDYIFSWIPSITQLSRQAIFRGDIPDSNYVQNPGNEEKLWKSFWQANGKQSFEIKYSHDSPDLSGLQRITRFAIVYNDLDEKMHSSTDYKDLKSLTENWVERSRITETINLLLENGFTVYLTSDHGNIQAKGWRTLKGREKLGTNKSGSRSQRHIEYTEKWLADEFMKTNTGINQSLLQENNVIYITDDHSFSGKERLVTHGGSHILEVLIPFIVIEK